MFRTDGKCVEITPSDYEIEYIDHAIKLIWNWLELFQAKLVQSDLINSLWIIQIDKTMEVVPHLLVLINYIYSCSVSPTPVVEREWQSVDISGFFPLKWITEYMKWHLLWWF